MSDDEIRREILKARADRLRAAREAANLTSASEAARRYGWADSTYRSHENGTRPFDDADADRYAAKLSRPGRKITGKDLMYGPPDKPVDPIEQGISKVSVVGRVGAGAVIEPEYDQDVELYQVELPYAVPVEMIGFQIEGDSMMPRYDDGEVILVWREQKRALESFYGQEAVVRTSDGRRYLKIIQYGKAPNTVNLQSFNAKMIENVRLEWIGEIYGTIKGDQVHRVSKGIRSASARRRPNRRGAG